MNSPELKTWANPLKWSLKNKPKTQNFALKKAAAGTHTKTSNLNQRWSRKHQVAVPRAYRRQREDKWFT